MRESRVKAHALVPIPPADREILAEMGAVGQAFLEAGAAAWLSRTDQLGLLRLIDDGWQEYEMLRKRWIASDFSNRDVARRLATVEENLTKWLSLAGLTPSDRARLGVAEVKARTKLDELLDRQASRRQKAAM